VLPVAASTHEAAVGNFQSVPLFMITKPGQAPGQTIVTARQAAGPESVFSRSMESGPAHTDGIFTAL
jgi:hypothetical protein